MSTHACTTSAPSHSPPRDSKPHEKASHSRMPHAQYTGTTTRLLSHPPDQSQRAAIDTLGLCCVQPFPAEVAFDSAALSCTSRKAGGVMLGVCPNMAGKHAANALQQCTRPTAAATQSGNKTSISEWHASCAVQSFNQGRGVVGTTDSSCEVDTPPKPHPAGNRRAVMTASKTAVLQN